MEMKTIGIIGFCLVFFLSVPKGLAMDYQTAQRYTSRVVQTEEPFYIDLDLDSILVNTGEKSLQIDGRFWVDTANVSVPVPTKYLGFSFGATLNDGDLWYRDYGSADAYVHKGKEDFNHSDSKCVGLVCYDEVYYTSWENIPDTTDKEFRLKFYFNEKPQRFLLYFGTGSYGIEVIDGTSEAINTSLISIEIGNAAGGGGAGHISNLWFADNTTANFTKERMMAHLDNDGATYSFKTGGACSWVEQGAVRAVLTCTENSDFNNYYIPNNMRLIYLESYHDNDKFALWSDNTLIAGTTTYPYLHMADGTWDGNWSLGGAVQNWGSEGEGWRGYKAGDYWLGFVWNLNDTYGRGRTTPDPSGVLDDWGYLTDASFNLPAATWYNQYLLIANASDGWGNDTLRHIFNSSFYADNTSITVNTGSVIQNNTNAIMLKLNGSHSDTTVDITITPAWVPTSPAHDGRLTLQSHNMSGVGDLYLYNSTDTGQITGIDLWHHYTYDSAIDYRWEYGASEPTFTTGNPISLGDNETQFCNATNYCNNVMTNAGLEEFYFVTQFAASTIRVRYTALKIDDIDEEIFSSAVYEYQPQTITGIWDTAKHGTDVTGFVVWNNTVYANDTSTMNATHLTLSTSFTTPNIETKEETVAFNWNYTNTTGEFSGAVHMQTIYEPYLDSCEVATAYSRNFRFYNETSDFMIVNATVAANLDILQYDQTYSNNFTFTNESHWICLFPSWGNFSVYGLMQYSNSSYRHREYYFDAEVFDNTSADMSFYLIDDVVSTRVDLIVKDSSGIVYPDVIIKIQRYYPGLNEYRTIAAPKTGTNGETNTYLVLYDAYYRFILQKGGEILDTVPAQLVTDTTLTLMVSPATLIERIDYWDVITGGCSYSVSTGNITCHYEDGSVGKYLVSSTLTVIEQGALITSEMCSSTNTTTPSGTIICHVGNVSGKIILYELVGNLNIDVDYVYVLEKKYINMAEGMSRLFGLCESGTNKRCLEGMFISFLIVLTSAMVGLYSPAIGIFYTLISVSITWYIGLFPISISSIIGLIFVGMIIVFSMVQKKR